MTSPTPQDLGDRELRSLGSIRLWFFRDLSEEQRRNLYGMCGFSKKLPERLAHGIEEHLFRYIFSALSQGASAPVPIVTTPDINKQSGER